MFLQTLEVDGSDDFIVIQKPRAMERIKDGLSNRVFVAEERSGCFVRSDDLIQLWFKLHHTDPIIALTPKRALQAILRLPFWQSRGKSTLGRRNWA